ncbi:hypothetical protein BDW67DRAFT_184534 [Aspergillus spinulosporus]
MEQPIRPFPIFYYGHKCHHALQHLQALLKFNNDEIFRDTQGEILQDAIVKFKIRHKELGSKEREKPWLDAQLADSPGKEVLLYHLRGLHQTLERSIDIAMYEKQSGGNCRAGTVLVGCLRVIADQISRLCLIVDEILRCWAWRANYPHSHGERLRHSHKTDSDD